MKYVSVLLLLLISVSYVQTFDLSIFYCGFGGDYCGQSKEDDLNPSASIVILAFSNTNSDGSVSIDDANFPTALVKKWQASGKTVVVSVGGQNGNWGYVFANSTSINNFVTSLAAAVTKYGLDGVDLDIESYNAAPFTVANVIIQLKKALGTKLIIVSPEDVAVYQGSAVPDANSTAGIAFNYFVPIIKLADKSIDYYQPQAYNNWYDAETGGSLRYLQDVYENWLNLQGTGQWDTPLPDFNGVDGNKLLIGVLASPSAGGAAYYATPATIKDFKDWILTKK
jgi:chitinase